MKSEKFREVDQKSAPLSAPYLRKSAGNYISKLFRKKQPEKLCEISV